MKNVLVVYFLMLQYLMANDIQISLKLDNNGANGRCICTNNSKTHDFILKVKGYDTPFLYKKLPDGTYEAIVPQDVLPEKIWFKLEKCDANYGVQFDSVYSFPVNYENFLEEYLDGMTQIYASLSILKSTDGVDWKMSDSEYVPVSISVANNNSNTQP